MKIREIIARAGSAFGLTASSAVDTDEMTFTAPVEFTAAEAGDTAKPATFTMNAYSGGRLIVPQFSLPVVVDLSGVTAPGRGAKVLREHDRNRIVGHAPDVKINSEGIFASGVVSGTGADAREVTELAKNGFPWEASIGLRKMRMKPVTPGRSVTVNGQTFEGPLLVARAAELWEISFVVAGADDQTSARVAASQSEGNDTMNFKDWLTAKGISDFDSLSKPVQDQLTAAFNAETKAASSSSDGKADDNGKSGSTSDASTSGGNGMTASSSSGDTLNGTNVQELVASAVKSALGEAHETWRKEQEHREKIASITARHPELTARAITEKWSAEKAELEVLKASRPNVSAFAINTGAGSGDVPNDRVLTAALCTAGNLPELDKSFDDKTLQAAHDRYRGRISLQQLILEAAWNGGYDGNHFDKSAGGMKAILTAAFSTSSLPGILSNVANKFMLQGFMAVERAWAEIAAIRNVSDFKRITSYRLTGNFEFEPIGPDGQIKHGELGEETFGNQARTLARMHAITRTNIINDDMGALTITPQRIGRGGALRLNRDFWTEFLNNATFFTAARGSFFAGADTALGVEGLTKATTAFMEKKDGKGKDRHPLGIAPSILLTPVQLDVMGSQLMTATQIRSTIGDKTYTTDNPHNGKYRHVSSAYLNFPTIPNGSGLAWYLLADPADLPVIEVCFLNGVQQPTVETADVDFNQLGIQMRGYFDNGVEKQDHLAGVKMKGES